MKISTSQLLIEVFLLSLITFDLQTKFLFPGVFYLNDFLLPVLFFYLLKEKFNIIITYSVSFFIFLLLFQMFKFSDNFLRDAQFISRSIGAFLVLPLILKNKDFFKKILLKYLTLVLILGYLAYFLLLINIDILPFTSGRSSFGTRQYSSIFSEPALFGLFTLFCLFTLYNPFVKEKSNKLILFFLLLSVILSQSLGATIGLLFYVVTYFYVNYFKSFLALSVIFIFLFPVFLNLMVLNFPENRISQAYSFYQYNDEFFDKSGKVRVTNEFDILFNAIKSNNNIAFFGGTNDTDLIRENYSVLAVGDISGNGLVELILRYGFIMTIIICFFLLGRFSVINVLLLIIFTQIDGAISKPYIFFYLIIITRILYYEKIYFSDNIT